MPGVVGFVTSLSTLNSPVCRQSFSLPLHSACWVSWHWLLTGKRGVWTSLPFNFDGWVRVGWWLNLTLETQIFSGGGGAIIWCFLTWVRSVGDLESPLALLVQHDKWGFSKDIHWERGKAHDGLRTRISSDQFHLSPVNRLYRSTKTSETDDHLLCAGLCIFD